MEKRDRIRQQKKALRKELLARRKALPQDYTARAGEKIQARVLSSPRYLSARSVFLYVSTADEPATGRILQQALADGKEVYVPRCEGSRMLAVRIRGTEELRPGPLGIPEPPGRDCPKTAPELDLILVPCVSASPGGQRLGHGGGFYDRFLAEGADRAVCLCFDAMLSPDLPMEETDIVIPHLVTESLSF